MRHALDGRFVETACDRGRSSLKNGELIAAAEAAGFEAFITTDKNLGYQQNLVGRTLAVVVLRTTSWPHLPRSLPHVVAALEVATKDGHVEVDVP